MFVSQMSVAVACESLVLEIGYLEAPDLFVIGTRGEFLRRLWKGERI